MFWLESLLYITTSQAMFTMTVIMNTIHSTLKNKLQGKQSFHILNLNPNIYLE